MRSILLLLVSCAVLESAYAALYSDPSQLPSKTYDYIIVGGGNGGSVVASRLAEDRSKNVLVIEAGPNDDGITEVQIPFICTTLSPNTPLDWNYTTTPQKGLKGRSIALSRGKLLGGSSSINYMIWNTGSVDDWQRYAKVTGDPGWSWPAVQPIIRSIERVVPPADNHNTAGQYNPAIHGHSGPVGISLQGFPSLMDPRVIATTKELPQQFPYNLDMNSGNPLGIGWTQYSVQNGSRVSSATAYLHPHLSSYSNLDVLVNTQVTKLIQTGTDHGTPVFLGVQFAQSSSGPKYALNATTEVIVSAGAIATPQLLMLSGIGGAADLKKFGIKQLVNLPDVGKNLQDHVVLPNVWSINASFTPDDIARNATLLNENIEQWATTKTGQFATAPATNLGWFRLPKNASIFKTQKDPSAGPTSPHFEFIFAEVFDSFAEPAPTSGHYMIISTNLFSPSARGTVSLASTNPFDLPLVDPAYLSTPFDIYTLREAVKAAQKFMSAHAWDGFRIAQFGLFAGVTTDQQIDDYARASAATVFHPVGTAPMSAYNASNGVVNPDMTVKKVKGLRIVDASVFPYIPTVHPQGIVYVFAERAAQLIKASHH